MSRATLIGLGRFGGGIGALRHLLAEGFEVTVTDLAPREAFADVVAELAHRPVRWVFGRHDAGDFVACDVVVASPAVPWRHPLLERARAAGIRVTSEVELFLERVRAPVLAVTGSNGKTTTATLLHALLETAGARPHLAGNMGISLLDRVGDLTDDRPLVFEISSFQLEALPAGRAWFAGGVLTSLTPNHIDRHGTFAAYVAAKRRLVEGLRDGAPLVCDADCAASRELLTADDVRRLRTLPVSRADARRLEDVARNRIVAYNLAQAFTLARAFLPALEEDVARRTARAFPGLPDRLEEVARRADGLVFVNDSKATTPEAAAAAIASYDAPVHLIAGGHDKMLDPTPLVRAAERCASVRLIGATAADLRAALARRGMAAAVFHDLETALRDLAADARGPGVALLSPGHASFGLWRDYRERGEAFRSLARGLASEAL